MSSGVSALFFRLRRGLKLLTVFLSSAWWQPPVMAVLCMFARSRGALVTSLSG
jgi:hypothetical protein